MKYITNFFWFWYDFIVGDAWEVAVGVVATFVVAWAIVHAQPELEASVGFLVIGAIAAIMAASLWQEQRRHYR